MAVDDDEDSPEAAAQRKQVRKDKRDNNRLKKMAIMNSMDNSPTASRASTEEPVETPKKRGRKPGGKNEKRKAEDGDEEPPAKKRRGPQGRASKVGANGTDSRLTSQQRETLQKSLRSLYDSLMNLEVDDIEAPEEDESDPGKRLIIGPFIKLPPKRDYADYYVIIQKPYLHEPHSNAHQEGGVLLSGRPSQGL